MIHPNTAVHTCKNFKIKTSKGHKYKTHTELIFYTNNCINVGNIKCFPNNLYNASDRSPEAYLVSEGGTVLDDVFQLSVLTTLTSIKVFLGVARRLCRSQEVLNEFTDIGNGY